MELSMKTLVVIAMALVIIIALIAFFFSGMNQPINEQRIFAQGCAAYCDDIKREASQTGEPLEIVAVRKADVLQGSDFLKACAVLYPDTRQHPYLCWNRGCCMFQLRPP